MICNTVCPPVPRAMFWTAHCGDLTPHGPVKRSGNKVHARRYARSSRRKPSASIRWKTWRWRRRMPSRGVPSCSKSSLTAMRFWKKWRRFVRRPRVRRSLSMPMKPGREWIWKACWWRFRPLTSRWSSNRFPLVRIMTCNASVILFPSVRTRVATRERTLPACVIATR